MSDSDIIRLPPGLFISATGTGVGKTFVTRGLASALRRGGRTVAALKPIETGFPDANPTPELTDAHQLAAAGQPGTAAPQPGSVLDGSDLEGAFYRAAMPAAPRAVSLATGAGAPDIERLGRAIERAARQVSVVLVEGAGGLLVPLDRERTIADLAVRLGLPVLLVAPNALGVLSHALTACESAARRELCVAALVLTELTPPDDDRDPSRPHNAAILRERLACPVLSFPFCPDATDEALADAAFSAQLPSLIPHALS